MSNLKQRIAELKEELAEKEAYYNARLQRISFLERKAAAGEALAEAVRKFGSTGCWECGDGRNGDGVNGCDCDPDDSDGKQRDAALSAYKEATKDV